MGKNEGSESGWGVPVYAQAPLPALGAGIRRIIGASADHFHLG
jgi:hypothetical protein